MEFREIEELLQKYYNGDTSIEEERTIKSFFKGNKGNQDLIDNDLFNYFENHESLMPEPEGLESKIIENIKNIPVRSIIRRKVISTVLYGIAAGIMLIFVIRSLDIKTVNDFSHDNMSTSIKKNIITDKEKCEIEIFDMLTGVSKGFSEYSDVSTPNMAISIGLSIKELILEFSDIENCNISLINKESLSILKERRGELSDTLYKNIVTGIDEVLILKIREDIKGSTRIEFLRKFKVHMKNNLVDEPTESQYIVFSNISEDIVDQLCVLNYQNELLTIYFVTGSMDMKNVRNLQRYL